MKKDPVVFILKIDVWESAKIRSRLEKSGHDFGYSFGGSVS